MAQIDVLGVLSLSLSLPMFNCRAATEPRNLNVDAARKLFSLSLISPFPPCIIGKKDESA